MSTQLPEAITNPSTPVDIEGNQIVDGVWYSVWGGRRKPTRVLVRFDPDDGEFLCQPKGGGFWQRVNEMDPSANWERVED